MTRINFVTKMINNRYTIKGEKVKRIIGFVTIRGLVLEVAPIKSPTT